MFAGPDIAAALLAAGVTHIVWIPDSELGTWDAALAAAFGPRLIRVCREGEAFAVAAGLWIGGQKPIVMIQCTGLFEAGDSLRNIVHDLGVPLFFVVGGYFGYRVLLPNTCSFFLETGSKFKQMIKVDEFF